MLREFLELTAEIAVLLLWGIILIYGLPVAAMVLGQ